MELFKDKDKRKNLILIAAGIVVVILIIVIIAISVSSSSSSEKKDDPKKYSQSILFYVSDDAPNSENKMLQILNAEFLELNKDNTELYINDRKVDFVYSISINDLNSSNVNFKIEFKFNHKLKTTKDMFKNCGYITKMDLTNLIFDEITDSSYMFYYCDYLVSLTFGKSASTNKIRNMTHMFDLCNRIKSLNLTYLSTASVEDMSYMFYYTQKLAELDIHSFDVHKVTTMENMFYESGITTLDLNSWDASNVESFRQMFYTSSISYLNAPHWKAKNVKDMSNMFCNCLKLTSLDLSSFDTSQVTKFDSMIYATGLTYLNLSNFNTSNAKDMSHMFRNSQKLTSLDLSSFDTSQVTNFENMFYMFESKTELKELNLCSFTIKENPYPNVVGMFSGVYYAKIRIKEETYNKIKDIGGSSIGSITEFNCDNKQMNLIK